MNIIKALTVFLIFFITCTNQLCGQGDTHSHNTAFTLEELKTYASDESYVLYPYYKGKKFHYSEYLKEPVFEINGDMHNYDFCLKLIATLGPFQKLENNPTIAIHFFNQEIDDFQEILFLSAIEKYYPSQYIEYLLSRASKLFQGDKLKDLERLNIDNKKIEELINTPLVALNAKKKIDKATPTQESKFYYEGHQIFPSIYLFKSVLPPNKFATCCDNFSSFIDCIYESKVHPLSLASALLRLPPYLPQLEENPTKEKIKSISNNIFRNASQEILQECLENCVKELCITDKNQCNEREICISYITGVSSSNSFKSKKIEQESDCIECPSNINITDKGVQFNLNFGTIPQLSNSKPDIQNPNSYPNFPWTAYIHIRESSFEYPVFRNQPVFISASKINQLLEQVSTELGDEACFELRPPSVYAKNKNCIKQQCISFDCPSISLSKQNGTTALSVRNYEPLIWGESTFEIDWNNQRYEIDRDIRIEMPINDLRESTVQFHRTNNCGERIANFGCNIGLDLISPFSECDRGQPMDITNIASEKIDDSYNVSFTLENIRTDSFDIQIVNSEIEDYSPTLIPIVECKGQNCFFQTEFGFGNWCFTITETRADNKTCPPIEICKHIEIKNENCSLKDNLSIELSLLESFENCNGVATIHINQGLEEFVFVDWGTGVGPVPILERHDLSPGSYRIGVYLEENNNYCLVKTIDFDIDADCSLDLTKLLHPSKKSSIVEPYTEFYGKKDYTYKWNTGAKTPVNGWLSNRGSYRLTVTDAKGCSAIAAKKKDLGPIMPIINNIEISEINYKTGEAKLRIDCSLPSTLTFQDGSLYDYALEYNISNEFDRFHSSFLPLRKLENSMEIRIGRSFSNGVFKITPFVTKKKLRERHVGASRIICIPDFEQLYEFQKTNIRIAKENDPNCTWQSHSLVGFCGGQDSCKIISTSLGVLKVPFGSFNIPLGQVNTSFFAEIQPVLEGSLAFNPSSGITTGLAPASTFSPIAHLGNNNWSDGQGCNCFDFEIDFKSTAVSNQTIEIRNHPDNPSGVHLTQTDKHAATLCVEESGTYCISIIDQNGCIVDYCREINIREIEVATLNTRANTKYIGYPKRIGNGEVLIILDDSTPAPVYWKHIFANKIVEKSDTKLHLNHLYPGKYEVEVTDATGCSRKIPFQINDCYGSSNKSGEQIAEWNLNSSGQVLFGTNLLSLNNQNQIGTNLLRDVNTWTLPDGTKIEGLASIVPIETGYYRLKIPSLCGGWNNVIRGYINPEDAFPDKIDVSVDNTSNSKPKLCVDLKTIKYLLNLLPDDYSFVSVEVHLDNTDNPRILYSKSFSRENIYSLLDDKFCATIEKGDHAPYHITIELEWQRNKHTERQSAAISLQAS